MLKKLFTSIWKNADKIGALVAIPISVTALKIAWNSESISDQANDMATQSLNLSRSEFESERQLILSAQIDSKEHKLLFKPIDNTMTLQGLDIHYPKLFVENPWSLRLVDNSVSTLHIGTEIEKYHREHDKVDYDKYAIIRQGFLPVIIQSHYTAKGAAYEDRSLYTFHYESSPKKFSPSGTTIIFTSVSFIRRLRSNEDIKDLISFQWSQVQDSLEESYKEQPIKMPNKSQ